MTRRLQISAGSGPAECSWVVAQVERELRHEAAAAEVGVTQIDATEDRDGVGFRSIVLSLGGTEADALAETWVGTVQWVGRSPVRPHHRRRNWFVAVAAIPEAECLELREVDIRWEVARGGGPGGQHVNRTETAVRAVHVPTGLRAQASDERSQHRNRAIARGRLALRLEQHNAERAALSAEHRWREHWSLDRGNAVRVYEGPEFRRVR